MNKEHYKVLERFYADCLKFWEREKVENPKEKALADLKQVVFHPFIARNAPFIDIVAKKAFIKTLE